MEELRLFKIKNSIKPIDSSATISEKSFRDLIEKNMDAVLGVKYIASEYAVGGNSGEFIDCLGLDENSSPVILKYKKTVAENAISEGLFYLNWLIEHKADFEKLVYGKPGRNDLVKINWTFPKLLCIADDFTKYDKFAVSQISRNIMLIRCRKYDDILLLEVVGQAGANATIANHMIEKRGAGAVPNDKKFAEASPQKPVSYRPARIFKIGYCSIENDKHYILLPNKEKHEIRDIPSNIYLGEGQFVLTDDDERFRWAYPYKYDNADPDSAGSYGMVFYKGAEVFIDKGNKLLEKIKDIPEGIQLIPKQIVLVDAHNSLLRFYKPFKHNADTILKSAKAKGHQMAFVLKKLSNGAILRNIETGEEFFRNMNTGDKDFAEHQVLCLAGDQIINVFVSYKFYTLSSFYNKINFGIVEFKGEGLFFRNLSGELVKLNNAPDNLEKGQTIYVDENNNFTGIIEESVYLFEQYRKKNNSNVPLQNKVNRSDAIEIKKDVLILGNKNYEYSYKLNLLKNGYRAEVIEGYESWAKISACIKDADIVVVVTSHISHDNMWRIKKEVTAIPVIYSEHDGANRILEEIIRTEKQQISG